MKKSYILVLAVLSIALLFTGCKGGKSSGSNVNDSVAPSDVTNFAAAGGDQTVVLTWDAATDNVGVAGYTVSMTVNSPTGAATLIDVQGGNTVTYTVLNLTNGNTYHFTIVAYDSNGNQSAIPASANAMAVAPDVDPPEDVQITQSQGGYHDPATKDYVQLAVQWQHSASADCDHYLFSISNDGGATWNILDSFDIGYINAIIVPDDPDVLPPEYPIADTDLYPPYDTTGFSIGFEYTIRIVAVDTSGNASAGVTVAITPTESEDVTPPDPVTNLQANAGDQQVDLTWDPVADAFFYNVYYREYNTGDPWVLVGNSFGTSFSVTDGMPGVTLVNGIEYEFMVAGVDLAGNETVGAGTPGDADDIASKVTAVPTTGAISIVPNIKGGVFRTGYLSAQTIVVAISTDQAGILSSVNTTELFYTLDGSAIDTTVTVPNATHGYVNFDPSNVTTAVATFEADGEPVFEADANQLYYIKIDFDPSTLFPAIDNASAQPIFRTVILLVM
jgi:hypothetical protein